MLEFVLPPPDFKDMTDTNDRPENEAWLFNALVDLEDQDLLGDFCRHVSLAIPVASEVIAEGVWPLIRGKYDLGDGRYDVARAGRDLLGFRPLTPPR